MLITTPSTSATIRANMPAPMAANAPPMCWSAPPAIMPNTAPNPKAPATKPITTSAPSSRAPCTSSGVRRSPLKQVKRSATSSAAPPSTLRAANSQLPMNTGINSAVASAPTNGIIPITAKPAIRITPRATHSRALLVKRAHASVHQPRPRSAATARASTLIWPDVPFMVGRLLNGLQRGALCARGPGTTSPRSRPSRRILGCPAGGSCDAGSRHCARPQRGGCCDCVTGPAA